MFVNQFLLLLVWQRKRFVLTILRKEKYWKQVLRWFWRDGCPCWQGRTRKITDCTPDCDQSQGKPRKRWNWTKVRNPFAKSSDKCGKRCAQAVKDVATSKQWWQKIYKIVLKKIFLKTNEHRMAKWNKVSWPWTKNSPRIGYAKTLFKRNSLERTWFQVNKTACVFWQNKRRCYPQIELWKKDRGGKKAEKTRKKERTAA